MTTTTTAPRLAHDFASLRAGLFIRFIDNTGTLHTGTIKRITSADRRTGFRKITFTSGTITFISPSHKIGR